MIARAHDRGKPFGSRDHNFAPIQWWAEEVGFIQLVVACGDCNGRRRTQQRLESRCDRTNPVGLLFGNGPHRLDEYGSGCLP